ncbi:MAG TPA: alpha/beta hydrolase [Pseudonocardiaceae bacterium]|jgi:pimeloyl-ACP methyl ester carboxylesterase|nr:alpha/beta hydrolase [Pseudonocardiaceae bacterium]
MKTSQIIGIAGAVVGVTTAGLTVAGVLQSRRKATTARENDPYQDEPLGLLEPDRTRTVAADDGVPLSVEEIDPADGGKSELTVVLVHGLALSRRCFHFQRRDIAGLARPRVRQVLYDQRGHGRSGLPPAQSCTIEQLGRDLDVVLRSVAPDGPLVLVGHSMGGMAIMALAEQRPDLFADRVRGVALIATSAGEVGSNGLPRPLLSRYNPLTRTVGEMASWQPELVDWIRTAGGGVTRQAVRRLAFGQYSVPASLVDFMVRMLSVTPVPVLTDFVPTLGTHNRYAALAGLRHCETLVISGDRDRITPFSHSRRIAAELPDAALLRVFGAGHMVMLEQQELVTDELVRFVRRCATRTRGLRRRWRRGAG